MEKDEQEKDLCLKNSIEEVVEEAEEGDLLVLRRTLSGLKGSQEEQRKNIFYARCTVNRKVCSLIIDSGSCTNVVSSSMVKKLQLEATAQPHPCTIQWLSLIHI